MNILMMSNTYKPHVGGVANSVDSFKEALEKRGNNLLVISPHFENDEERKGVLRVNAIQNFNGSDFSVSLPAPSLLSDIKSYFTPDIVHSHHPFLLGNSALRVAASENIPIVFTHHTLYERYTHYIPGDSDILKELAVKLSVEYSNICDCVIAPSESIRDLLIQRGVKTDIRVIPTGVDVDGLSQAPYDKELAKEIGIEKSDFVIGHVSRLANEKNQQFLCICVGEFLQKHKNAKFLIVGDGDIKEDLKAIFTEVGVVNQVIFVGVAKGEKLKKFYAMMDIFCFTSTSETQGMVIAEALSAKTPVVALKASGVSEMITTMDNGILIEDENLKAFVDAFEFYYSHENLEEAKRKAFDSAKEYSIEASAKALEDLYAEQIIKKESKNLRKKDFTLLDKTVNRLDGEYKIWKSKINSFFKVAT